MKKLLQVLFVIFIIYCINSNPGNLKYSTSVNVFFTVFFVILILKIIFRNDSDEVEHHHREEKKDVRYTNNNVNNYESLKPVSNKIDNPYKNYNTQNDFDDEQFDFDDKNNNLL